VKIKVIMDGKERTINLDEGSTILDVLNVSGTEKNEVLTFRGGELMPFDETVKGGDEIEVMRVVTGG
jgi:sulfur carrier protein ThiS